MFSRRTVPVHPEDEKILSIIRELCAQLNYYKFNIQTISWLDRMGIRRVPPDALLISRPLHILYLSKQAVGQLTPEEWRPILASGLLYYKNLTRGMLKAILPTMATSLIAPLVFVLIDVKFLGYATGIVFDILIFPVFVVLAFSFLLLTRLQKKFYFENDDKAAQLVGKEALIASLMKLDAINAGTRGKRGFIRPSIQERIQHLSTTL